MRQICQDVSSLERVRHVARTEALSASPAASSDVVAPGQGPRVVGSPPPVLQSLWSITSRMDAYIDAGAVEPFKAWAEPESGWRGYRWRDVANPARRWPSRIQCIDGRVVATIAQFARSVR